MGKPTALSMFMQEEFVLRFKVTTKQNISRKSNYDKWFNFCCSLNAALVETLSKLQADKQSFYEKDILSKPA